MREQSNTDESVVNSPKRGKTASDRRVYESSGGDTLTLAALPPAISEAGNQTQDRLRKLGDERKKAFSTYKNICLEILHELKDAEQFLDDGLLTDDGLSVAIEVEHYLNELYTVPWGENETLKKIVTIVQSQILNIHWKRAHIEFLRDAIGHINRQYHIDESVVAHCYELIDIHGLDKFRGTVSETAVRKKFKIVESNE